MGDEMMSPAVDHTKYDVLKASSKGQVSLSGSMDNKSEALGSDSWSEPWLRHCPR